jgi:glycerol-3-phosphate acyltransferase PlsY
MMIALFVLGAYLLGSVPFGLILGLCRGVDVRQHGSRNIGATNVGRVIGRPWGYLCLVLDILKGFAPTLTALFVIVRQPADAVTLLAWLAVALAAVLGHLFPVYLRFRGGKGVATTIGVALGIYPYFTVPMVVALAGYAVMRFTTGIVSAGSLTIAVLFPAAFAVQLYLDAGRSLAEFWPLQVAAILLGAIIVVRHRSNIARMLRGEERALSAEGGSQEST